MKMESKKPYLVVLLVQFIYTGYFLLSKAAFDAGMNISVFVFYRQAFSTVFLLPLAIFSEWKNALPLSFVILCKMFMLSLCGITLSLNIYGVGLVHASASMAAAMPNCLPAITLLLAVVLRMEMVNLRTHGGIAKIAGIVLCLGGVTTIAFYNGPSLALLHHHLLGPHNSEAHQVSVGSPSQQWIKGCFFLLLSNVLWGLWIVLQVSMMKSYPSKIMFTTLQCLLSSIQSFFVAIAVERRLQQWKLRWNVTLLAVIYSGIVVTGVAFYLQTWVIEKKGPVFLGISTPLALVFTTFGSVLLFGEDISLGSVLGGILLVGALYSVLWGKSRERNKVIEIGPTGKEEIVLTVERRNGNQEPSTHCLAH